MKDFYRNHQWDLERVSAIPGNISYDGLDFSTMRFIFYFRRRSLYYSVLSIFPGVLMSILQMFSHTLPVEHPARMTLLTSLFVSASVLQSSLASQMPKSSDGISLIQMYLMIFSSNLIISMVVTFVNMHVWFRVPLADIPSALRMLKSFLIDTGGTTGRMIPRPGKQGFTAATAAAKLAVASSRTPPGGVRHRFKSDEDPQTTLLTKSADATPAKTQLLNESEIRPAPDPTTSTQLETGPDEGRQSRRCCLVFTRRRRRGQAKPKTNKGRGSVSEKKAATGQETPTSFAKLGAVGPRNSSAAILGGKGVQTSQVADRKERWLRFSMKVDKAFLYAMAIFNTLCPITIFLIVPQFQTYSDGET